MPAHRHGDLEAAVSDEAPRHAGGYDVLIGMRRPWWKVWARRSRTYHVAQVELPPPSHVQMTQLGAYLLQGLLEEATRGDESPQQIADRWKRQ